MISSIYDLVELRLFVEITKIVFGVVFGFLGIALVCSIISYFNRH